MKRRVLVLSLLMMTISTPALAEDKTKIEIYSEDQTLNFKGAVAGEHETVTDDLQVTATGGEVKRLRFFPHELIEQDGPEEIPRKRVKLSGDRQFRDGETNILEISVIGGVQEPGSYVGMAEIRPGDQAPSEEITLKLKAKARPDVTLVPEDYKVTLDLVTCRRWMKVGDRPFPLPDCLLAGVLIPGDPFQEGYEVPLYNKTHDEVSISSTEIVVSEEKDNKQWTPESGELKLSEKPEDQTWSSSAMERLPITFDRDAMTPGHYSGYISLKIKGAEEPLNIPVDIMVRTGPIWAILALLAGVIIGQFGRILDEQKKENEKENPDHRKNFWQVLRGDFTRGELAMKITAIVGAVITGLVVVYAGEQGATFGANGIADALAIGAWGFAADLSSRGILKSIKR